MIWLGSLSCLSLRRQLNFFQRFFFKSAKKSNFLLKFILFNHQTNRKNVKIKCVKADLHKKLKVNLTYNCIFQFNAIYFWRGDLLINLFDVVILSLLIHSIICSVLLLNLVDFIETFELRWSLWPRYVVKIIIIVTIHKCHLGIVDLRFTGRLQLFLRIRWFLGRPQSYLRDCVWRRYLRSVISGLIHDRILFGLDLSMVRHLRCSDVIVFRVRLSIVVAVCSWIVIVILFFVHCLLFSKYISKCNQNIY